MIARRGLSLLELMLTIGLALILLGVAVIPRGGKGASSQGLAQMLAEELRASRIRAMTTGKPVALVLPSDNGNLSHSQSFYVMEGFSTPSVTRVVNFAGEFPRSSLFVGVWELNVLQLRNPFLLNTARPQAAGLLADGFDPAQWLPANFKDYALIFTPSGGVTSNGLANFDGDYHVLVSQGVTYGAGVPPAGAPLPQYPIAYRHPNSAGLPWTVNISRTGSISVTPGVTGAADVQASAHPLESGPHPAPPRLSAGANHDPVLVDVESRPQAVAGTLPAGASASLGNDGHLTLRVRAKDPDGDALWLKWTCSLGKLSGGLEEMRMEPGELVNKERIWEGTWEWVPPSGSWSSADLTFQVSDRRGGVVSGNLGSTPRVAQLAPGKLAFVRDDCEICVCKPDGTSILSYAADDNDVFYENFWTVSFSPDGSRLALGVERVQVEGDEERSRIAVMSSDLRLHQETGMDGDWDSYETPSWNSTGTRLGVTRTRYNADYDVVCSNITDLKANTQTSNMRVGTSAQTVTNFSYAPSGNKYCYLIYDPTLPPAHCSSIMVGTVGGGEIDLLHGTTTPSFADDLSSPSFSPAGDRIVFNEGVQLKVIPSSGGTAGDLFPGAVGYAPIWAPVGEKVAYIGRDERLYVVSVGGTPQNVSAGYLPSSVAWSPDATQLAFAADLFGPDEEDYNIDLFRVNADGTQLVNLTNTPDSSEDCPAWSQR
ncbi:MAG: hypothetical protein KF760_05415 [Candidatus Eremiobacteraeota bacterium]|nr:hypothetical protein [Candidatus Eremiobacteraeota bacterium]MCW5867742.1 hypothetical protein [Candidatus Eremiobacteraeota bacterium]